MKLGELAQRLGAELRGDPELEVTGVRGIEEAEGERAASTESERSASHRLTEDRGPLETHAL